MAQPLRFSAPPPPRRRSRVPVARRSPIVQVERLWGRLTDLFRPRSASSLAIKAVLAPRRLEPRRMLDAAAAALALETLDYAADFVQAGPDAASLAPAHPQDNGSANIVTPQGSLVILPPGSIDENGVAELEFVYEVPGAHTVEIDWGDGTPVESFGVSTDSQGLSTTHTYLDDPFATTDSDFTITVRILSDQGTVEDSTPIDVFNVDPKITFVSLAKLGGGAMNEGDVAELTVNFDDPGTIDGHTLTVNWGDGQTEVFVLNTNGIEGPRQLVTTHQYLDDPPTGNTTGSYTASISIVDDDGGSDAATASIDMLNVDPTITFVSLVKLGGGTMNEGDVAELTVNFDDPGTLDGHTITVAWGDGDVETFVINTNGNAGPRQFITTHQYLDDPPTGNTTGSYTATVSIVDDDTGSDSETVTINMLNVAPTITFVSLAKLGGGTMSEGDVAELTVNFDDPGTIDGHTISVQWGDGQTETFVINTDGNVGPRQFTTTHQYLDDPPTGNTTGSYTATVSIVDDDTQSDSATVSISVLNVAPTITFVSLAKLGGGTMNEGDVAELTVNFDDPGTIDGHTITVNWGDGQTETFVINTDGNVGPRVFTTTHQYLDDPPTGNTTGSYTASVSIVDDDTGSDSESVTINMANVAPTITFVSLVKLGGGTMNEGDVAELTVNFDDPGTIDGHTVTVNWGDGQTETFVINTDGNAGPRQFITTHQYLDDPPTGNTTGSYTATVSIVDDDAGSDSETVTINMLNVAPTITFVSLVKLGGGTMNEGDVAELTVNFDDPGTIDGHTITVNWGDGQTETFVINTDGNVGPRQFTTTHQYLDDPPTGNTTGSYTATVSLVDDDTGSDSESVTINMLNVAPTITFVSLVKLGGGSMNEGDVAELTVNFDDPGTIDGHTITVNWGDGQTETFVINTDGNVGPRQFTTTHQYIDDPPTGNTTGSYTATVSIVDDDTGADSETVTINMLNVAPTITFVSLAKLGGGTMNEGDVAELTINFDDPGTIDGHTITVNWGDGDVETFVINTDGDVGPRQFTTTHQYRDDPPSGNATGSYTATIDIVDDDTGADSATVTIQMLNVNPDNIVVTPPSGTVEEGHSTSISVTFADVGVEDTHSYLVDWGDGKTSSAAITGYGFTANHIYADNGNYTVKVAITDDDTGVGNAMTSIAVINVAPAPIQAGPFTTLEGSTFVLSGATRLQFTDFGFDNPLNTDPTNGGETVETFTYSIDWNDGTAATTGVAAIDAPGSEGVLTQGSVSTQHIFADNGEYLVTITIFDDDLGQSQMTFLVSVANVAPTIIPPAVQPVFQINEGQTVTIPDFGGFTDPGFNNPANAGNASNGGEFEETFTYTVDWGDGTVDHFTPTWTDGGENVLTAGQLGGASHFYADNPDGGNVYHVVITLTDDDLGVVTRVVDVTVLNVNPTLNPVTATDVNPQGFTVLNLQFTDPGADQYRVLIDWGDNLNVADPQQRFEIIDIQPTPDGSGVHTYQVTHQYAGPPDPLHPTDDIVISVKIWDDEFVANSANVPDAVQPVVDPGQSNVEVVVIGNFGIGDNNPVFIDTTPQVPMLTITERPSSTTLVVDASTAPAVTTTGELGGSGGESVVTGERYLELRIINPDGTESPEGIPLAARWLTNLAGLFRRLPDNHYAIYLVQAETDVRRLVIEVYVRNGKLIDPGDDSEGARDRPPTDETSQGAVEEKTEPAGAPTGDQGAFIPDWKFEAVAPVSSAALRHGRVLAGAALGLAAAGQPWLWQVNEALAEARPDNWRRLRTARHWRRRRPR